MWPLRSSSIRSDDIGLDLRRRATKPVSINSLRCRLAESLVGYVESGPKPDFDSRDLGLATYTEHVERCMRDFCTDPPLQDFFEAVGVHDHVEPEKKLERLVEMTIVVAELLLQMEPRASVESLSRQLWSRHCAVNETLPPPALLQKAGWIVFACIGWTSAMFRPVLHPVPPSFSPSRQFGILSVHELSASAFKRPVGALLRGLGVMPLPCLPASSFGSGQATLLSVSSLNFFSLKKIGGLTISWTDNLPSHCKLDMAKKELMIFRFPSVCLHIHNSKSETTIVGRMSSAHPCENGCAAGADAAAKSYMAEILLSTRLLFGQDKKSRTLYRETEMIYFKNLGCHDPLLDQLCSRKRLPTNSLVRDVLRERDIYSSSLDFPLLGKRLVELQKYSLDQKPRSLFNVWDDQRDPQLSFTFRAVILIGGISILLSLIQVLLSVGQLVLQYRSLP